jgi:tryptophan-rich sensory protein
MSALVKPVLSAAGAALLVAALGSTITNLGPWYQSLAKPDWQPPDWSFGVVWTAVFAFAAAAGVIAWRRAATGAAREWLVGLFALNGLLNVAWSLLFFRLQRPDWALLEVVLLWASIVALIIALSAHSRWAGLLLTPYLIWVTLASVLNAEVVRLNGPFG